MTSPPSSTQPLQTAHITTIPNKHLKKRTMVKDLVGKCRAVTSNLPQDSFIFGIQNKWGQEGCGDVISSWDVSKLSKAQSTQQSFPATNREALAHGHLTAKAQRIWGADHPVMKANPQTTTKVVPKVHVHKAHAFGIKSEQNEIPMALIMSAPDDAERSYPDFSGVSKRGHMPAPRGTKSSKLYAESSAREKDGVKDSDFKMKKFKNVPSRISMGR